MLFLFEFSGGCHVMSDCVCVFAQLDGHFVSAIIALGSEDPSSFAVQPGNFGNKLHAGEAGLLEDLFNIFLTEFPRSFFQFLCAKDRRHACISCSHTDGHLPLRNMRPFPFASVLAFYKYASASSLGSNGIQRLESFSSPKLGQWAGSMNQGASPNESPLKELICLATSLGILTRPRVAIPIHTRHGSVSRASGLCLLTTLAKHDQGFFCQLVSMRLDEQIFSPGWRVVQLCLLEVLSLLVLGDNKFAIWLRGQRLLLSLGCTFDNMDLFQLQLGLYKTWQDFGHAPLFCKEITVVSFTVSGENEE